MRLRIELTHTVNAGDFILGWEFNEDHDYAGVLLQVVEIEYVEEIGADDPASYRMTTRNIRSGEENDLAFHRPRWDAMLRRVAIEG